MFATRKICKFFIAFLALTAFAGEATAAVCTSLSAGRWDQAARWSCGRVPNATDTVVIAHNNVQMRANEAIAGLTINAGAVIDDNGNRLTVSGSVVNNGTFGVAGGGGRLIMDVAGTTISGNGSIVDARLYVNANNITLSAGSTMNFTNGAQLRVGSGGAGTLNINGSITDTGITAGARLLRVYNGSAVTVNGILNTPNSWTEIRNGGAVTNNGTVNFQYFSDQNNPTTWTQGPSSSLTVSQPIALTGTFNASAVGNTVTFNGTATVINPATYYNLAGAGIACPLAAGITVLGSTPCGPAAPTVITTAATLPTTVGATLNGTVSSNQVVTTPSFQYGLTGAYGGTMATTPSSLPANAVGAAITANVTGLTCGTLYHYRAVGTNSLGTTNGADMTFNTAACPPAPAVVSMNASSVNPTAANTVVTWAVIFNSTVTGVDLTDFTLTSTGGVVGASLTSISGTGSSYTVTANTGTGTVGTLTLKLVDDDSIKDATLMPLGGVGVANGNFSGQAYTLVIPTCTAGLLFCDDFERTVIVGGANAATTVGAAPGYGAWTVAGLNGGALGNVCNGVAGNAGCAGIDSDIPPFNVLTSPRANPTKSLYTRWSAVTVTSPVINLAGKGGARLSFWLRRGSDCFSEWPSNNTVHTFATCGQAIPAFTPTAGEEFQVQYLNNLGAWVVIAQYPMDDAPGQIFVPVIGLPDDALHANFQFRFAQPGGSGSNRTNGGAPGVQGYDYWHVDNVVLEETTAVSYVAPFCDTFEGDLSGWDMAGTGNVRIGATHFELGAHGMDLRWNTVSATSKARDLSGGTGNNTITFWVKRGTGLVTTVPNVTGSEFPDTAAKGLKVEYLSTLGTWKLLGAANFPGAGTQGQIFSPALTPASNSIGIPADANLTGFRLRITMLAGSGLFDQDYWHVDNVCVGTTVGSTDLSMTMGSAGVFSPGQYVTYTMVVTNNGPNADPGPISIADTLPAGLTFVGGSAGWACSAAGQDVTCTQNSALANGASTTLTITATVDAGASGTITNTATVGGQTNDTSLANNTVSKTDNLFVPGYVFTDKACVMDGTPIGSGAQCSEITWNPQTAGNAKSGVFITAVNASMVPTALHATNATTVNMQYGLSCHDPVANAGVQATISAAISGANTAGALPLCTSNGASPVNWTAAVGLSFPAATASVGPYSFNYNDVGAVELFMRNSAATAQIGSSGKFVVKPAAFAFSILRDSDNFANPAASNAMGTAFVKAGELFKLTISAVTSGGAVTPNYGNEAPPNKEAITVTSVAAPGLGLVSNGVLTGTFGAIANGVMAADGVSFLADGVTRSTPFAWSEVGILQLTAAVTDGSYNPGGFAVPVAPLANPYAISSVALVGRFYPDHFDTVVTAPMDCTGLVFAPACPDNSLIYSGQQFEVSVQAKNTADQITQNYRYSVTATQNFAKSVTLSAVDAAGTAIAGGVGILNNTAVANADFNNGVNAAGTSSPDFTFVAPATMPTDVFIHAVESGLDSVTSSAHQGGFKVVQGRIKVSNAYGGERLPLNLTASVEYCAAVGAGVCTWVRNGNDNSSQFDPTTNVVAAIVQGNLLVTDITAPGGMIVLAGGSATFSLNAPNKSGTASISLNAPAYLLSVGGEATFGVYKGGNQFIYQREAY